MYRWTLVFWSTNIFGSKPGLLLSVDIHTKFVQVPQQDTGVELCPCDIMD